MDSTVSAFEIMQPNLSTAFSIVGAIFFSTVA